MNLHRSILYEGYDKKTCFVHARLAAHNAFLLVTAQKMDVAGSDCFFGLQTNLSFDGGASWTGFSPDPVFESYMSDGLRCVCCDMTPMYHKKTGRFLVTGHIAQYEPDSIFPVKPIKNTRITPYAVFDERTQRFGPVRAVGMPDPVKYCDCGSGCSQCFELPDGDILIPISFREKKEGVSLNAKAAVMRCSFDGETLCVKEIGSDIEVPDEVRGIGECSVICHEGRFFLTIRGDTYGYVSVSDDGLRYTQPSVWKWDTGCIVPTYNTQSHWMHQDGKLFLVYTRRDGKNDHVFRNRAPLYAAQADADTLTLLRNTEAAVVPERGARLGNFGVCSPDDTLSYVIAAEWMQPAGCERYGSDNAVWLVDIRSDSGKEPCR